MKMARNTVDVVVPKTLSEPRKYLYCLLYIVLKISAGNYRILCIYRSAEVFCQLENIVSLKIKRFNSIVFP